MPRTLADLIGTHSPVFRVGKAPTRATFDASGLTAPRVLTVQNASGTLALTADVAAAQAAAIAYAIQRANHTGTQLAVTISDFAAAALAATAAAYDPVGSAAAAQAYAVQRANHTGTQLAVTISDFAPAVVAAGGGVWQPLDADLTGLASDYDAATKTLTSNVLKASTSAGLIVHSASGATVVTLGPGSGQSAMFADGISAVGLVQTRPATTQDGIALSGRAGGTNTYTQTLTTAALTGNRTATFPDAAITVAGIDLAQTWTASQTFAAITATTIGGSDRLTISGSRAGALWLRATNTSNAAAASANLDLVNDTSVSGSFAVYSSGSSTTRYGQALASWAEFGVGGTAGGLAIGSLANVPILFGSNNLEVARLSSGTIATGSFQVKYSTAGTSTTAAAAVITGGLGVGGAAFFGGVVTVPNGTDATTTGDGSVRLSGGLSQADGKQIVQGATSFHYWGPSGTDGSWRFGRSGNDFVIQRREAGVWVTKQTIAA